MVIRKLSRVVVIQNLMQAHWWRLGWDYASVVRAWEVGPFGDEKGTARGVIGGYCVIPYGKATICDYRHNYECVK